MALCNSLTVTGWSEVELWEIVTSEGGWHSCVNRPGHAGSSPLSTHYGKKKKYVRYVSHELIATIV
jgi:hypothetical protein